jgi:hypothetical protein
MLRSSYLNAMYLRQINLPRLSRYLCEPRGPIRIAIMAGR